MDASDLQDLVDCVIEALPEVPRDRAQQVLRQAKGDVNQAVEILQSEPSDVADRSSTYASGNRSSTHDPVDRVIEVLPEVTRDRAQQVLRHTEGDVNQAVERLLFESTRSASDAADRSGAVTDNRSSTYDPIDRVIEVLPEVTRDRAQQVLRHTEGDVNQAVERLLFESTRSASDAADRSGAVTDNRSSTYDPIDRVIHVLPGVTRDRAQQVLLQTGGSVNQAVERLLSEPDRYVHKAGV